MKYRKKPIVVEAVRWLGNNDEVRDFLGVDYLGMEYGRLTIQTLEGPMHTRIGCWVVRGIRGEHYAIEPDIFAATYEPVEGDASEEPA